VAPVGGGLIAGAPAVEVAATATADTPTMHRRAMSAKYERAGSLGYFVERVRNLLKYHDVNLQYEAIVGDGSTVGNRVQELGVINTPGVGSVAKTTTLTAALRLAVAAVQGRGFDGSLTVVGNPADLATLLDEADYRADRFPQVDGFVSMPPLAAGTLVVGDFSQLDLYVQKPGRTLSSTVEDGDDFLRGIGTMLVDQHCYLDVRQPGAFAKITGV
jgi:hypothetical protein